MHKALGLICRAGEVIEKVGKFFNHHVIIRHIVTGYQKDLNVRSELSTYLLQKGIYLPSY